MALMHAAVTSVGGEVPGGDPAARHAPARRDGFVLTLRRDGATCGVGEASPLPGYSPDTLEQAGQELAAWQPPPHDAGESPEASLARATVGLRSPSARFAVEAAMLDSLGRRAGVPAHRLLGAPRDARAVPLGYLISVAGAAEQALRLRARGVRHLKLKVGAADPDAEIQALRAVRAAVPDAEIRLDANGKLPAAAVAARCRAYAAIDVALIEEPCSPEVLAHLPRLAIAVALDESLARPDAGSLLAAVAGAQTLAAVVLKPTVLGGLTRCLQLASIGRSLGTQPIVTHTFDGPVAMAAAAELALALPDARIAGLAPHPYLSAYPHWQAAALSETMLTSHDTPGLGLRDVA